MNRNEFELKLKEAGFENLDAIKRIKKNNKGEIDAKNQ